MRGRTGNAKIFKRVHKRFNILPARLVYDHALFCTFGNKRKGRAVNYFLRNDHGKDAALPTVAGSQRASHDAAQLFVGGNAKIICRFRIQIRAVVGQCVLVFNAAARVLKNKRKGNLFPALPRCIFAVNCQRYAALVRVLNSV